MTSSSLSKMQICTFLFTITVASLLLTQSFISPQSGVSASTLSRSLRSFCYGCSRPIPDHDERTCGAQNGEQICGEHQACGRDICSYSECDTQCGCSCQTGNICKRSSYPERMQYQDDRPTFHRNRAGDPVFRREWTQKRTCQPDPDVNLGVQP